MKTPTKILLIISLLVSNNLFAQTTKLKKGDKLFDSFSFEQSIAKYEAITDKTDSIKRNLAESYYHIGKYEKSEQYYAELATSETRLAEDVYNYASVLAVNNKHEESSKWMQEFYKLDKNDSRGIRYARNPTFYDDLLKDKGQFSIKNLDINSDHEDFGAIFFKNQVMFASSREKFRFTRRKWNWNNLPFLDLYVADKDAGYELTNPKNFRASVNKKYHEGPASFATNGNFMAFTRNNYKTKSKDGSIKLEIYTSVYKDGKWQEAQPVPFNNKDYSVGHAALSPDGHTMYFASDMPGGKGGVDLYVVYKDKSGNWGKPINLGSEINTEGNEMFPYFHTDGFLFFASNGLPGLGGLDVFVVNVIDSVIVPEPINLGTPINSSYDDFALVMDSAQTAGYFSSNRPGGKGDDDIYKFRLLKPLVFNQQIIVNVKDDMGNILADTEVKLFDNQGNLIETIKTDTAGAHKFTIEESLVYLLKGDKEGYTNDEKEADATTKKSSYTVDLVLRKPEFFLVCYAVDADTKETIPATHLSLLDKNSGNTKVFDTDNSGIYSRELENVKIGDSLKYSANFEKEGYLVSSSDFLESIDREGRYELIVKLNKIGTDLNKTLNLKPIYFDYAKSNIRTDAAIELDKVVKVLNDNPEMSIELSAHTDCRGSAESNMRLSDRRAKSAAKYIKERISKPERITGKGYGETQPVNHCKCEGNERIGLKCKEQEHQLNRRTEFKIIK